MDVAHYLLEGNVDAVEFCPHYPYHDFLVAATYTLQEGENLYRNGGISLFSIKNELGLRMIQHVDTAGVFDVKWSPYGGNMPMFLGQVDADGFLRVYELEGSNGGGTDEGAALKLISCKKISSSMCLYLDWSSSPSNMAVTHSDGSLSIATFSESQIKVSKSWQAHEFELWTATFDTHQPHLLYSGSDDCRFKGWDLREDGPSMIFNNSKSHPMGVCCIQKNPYDSNLLLTGSYDELLRLWDVRSTSRPILVGEIPLDGGVWRIKYHPDDSSLVLAACMHNGFAIVKIEEERMQKVESYTMHESLAYGADWHRGDFFMNGEQYVKSLVATCSFYDRSLRLWIPEVLKKNKAVQ